MSSPEKKDLSFEHQEKGSHLGPTYLFQGEVSGKEDLVVHGQMRGKIRLPEADILVTEQGKIEAETQVRNITIRGEVIGNIEASGKVVVEKTGRLTGDLSASVISIEEGAQFKGAVKILGKK